VHTEAHCDDFEHEFSNKDITENSTDLLELLIVLSFIASVIVIGYGHDDRVEDDCKDNYRLKKIGVSQRNYPSSEESLMVEKVERFSIVNIY